MKIAPFTWLMFITCFFAWPTTNHANQITNLNRLIKSIESSQQPHDESWTGLDASKAYSPVYIGAQDGLMQADKIDVLPGQPAGVNFDQYAGYVTVDPKNGRALFYYFAESPQDPSTKPLVLWLNGGPGCSSLIGAMIELGPFRVNPDGKTLYKNDYAWNNEANVIFLESPAGVGFSYSNTTSDYDLSGDKRTAEDAYTFLVNWLERFPQYKNRDFFLTGESYSGHYVPQLAYTILLNNKNTNQTVINLKGIAVGNPYIDDELNTKGRFDFLWNHALVSDETHAMIQTNCYDNKTTLCSIYQNDAREVVQDINNYNVYAPLCEDNNNQTTGSIMNFDPCSELYMLSYLNTAEVQKAIHANIPGLQYEWSNCNEELPWKDAPSTILPIMKQLIASGIRIWLYSGDTDSVCPVTGTRYFINKLGVTVDTPWRPWYSHNEVGGYVVGYKGLALVTIRGAGHLVPSYQPQRALIMISSFLQGILPPSS